MAQELREGYRKAKIEEFIDNFKFEVYSEGYVEDSIEDFCGWYKYKFGVSNWRDVEEIEEEIEKGNIQVKI